jgi:hypothetical protein
MNKYITNYIEKKNTIVENNNIDVSDLIPTYLNSTDMLKSWYEIRENVNSYACHLMALDQDDDIFEWNNRNIVKILKTEEPQREEDYDLSELNNVNSIKIYKEKTDGDGNALISDLPLLLLGNDIKQYNKIVIDALLDLATQLQILHNEKNMVHGDICLDNIKYKYDKDTRKLTLLLDNFHASFFCFEGSPALGILNPVRRIPPNLSNESFFDYFSERMVTNLHKSYVSPMAYNYCKDNNGYIIPNSASDFWGLLILTCDLLLRRKSINPEGSENWDISDWIKNIKGIIRNLIKSNLLPPNLCSFLENGGNQEEFSIYIHVLSILNSGTN